MFRSGRMLPLAATLLAVALSPVLSATTPPKLATLYPGEHRTITQTLPVNVVFIGYRKGSGPRKIDERLFRSQLPAGSRTRVRYPTYYYGIPDDLGLAFKYSYTLTYADAAFEDAFFARLAALAQAKPLTEHQTKYNAQQARSLTIPDNTWIDAPSVEKWLAQNAGRRLKVDTSRPTVFFINWFGRKDFKHHVYTRIGNPDPDTGYDFGAERESRKLMAWGGTPADGPGGLGSTNRIWFYDLSAGPDRWADGWNLDDLDSDEDGQIDYRIPPIWEYGSTKGYRPFTSVSLDLAKVTRWIAVDGLFTPSPIYSPMLPAAYQPVTVDLKWFLYPALDGYDAHTNIKLDQVTAELGRLRPTLQFSSSTRDLPFEGEAAAVYRSYITAFTDHPQAYYPDRINDPWANLFLYHTDHLQDFLGGDADYSLLSFTYSTSTEEEAGDILGYADDNWVDGTQSFLFLFTSPLTRELGYGQTSTQIHETGHHLGLSHPHDGYDSETGIDFYNAGRFRFVDTGDEVNSVMSYISLSNAFSQFDRDAMHRWLTAGYVNAANDLLAGLAAKPDAISAADLRTADNLATRAIADLQATRYERAAAGAQSAYARIAAAARRAGVAVRTKRIPKNRRTWGRDPRTTDRLRDFER